MLAKVMSRTPFYGGVPASTGMLKRDKRAVVSTTLKGHLYKLKNNNEQLVAA